MAASIEPWGYLMNRLGDLPLIRGALRSHSHYQALKYRNLILEIHSNNVIFVKYTQIAAASGRPPYLVNRSSDSPQIWRAMRL